MAGSLAEVLASMEAGGVAGIDMPLGLVGEGWRTADGEARRRLGARRSSIFAIPPAAVWEQPDYRSALAVCRPAPFHAVKPPSVNDVAPFLFGGGK